MTYKQIEASRELRLWIVQVIIPVMGITAVALGHPEIRQEAGNAFHKVKEKFQTKKDKDIEIVVVDDTN